MSLKSFLAFTVITAWNWGTWAFLINIPFWVRNRLTRNLCKKTISNCLSDVYIL